MAEYIEKETVIANLMEQIEKGRDTAECEATELVIKRFAEYISSFPAADVQPVDIISADTRSEIIGYFYEFNVRADIKIEDLVDDVITIITNNLNNGK